MASVVGEVLAGKQGVIEAELGEVSDAAGGIQDSVEVIDFVLHDARMKVGSALPMLLGALLGLTAADENIVAGLASATQPISVLIVVIFSIGIGATTAMNIYCGVLSTITVGQTFMSDWKANAGARIVLSCIFIVLALAMAYTGRIAKALGGVDIASLVAFAVVSPLYYVLAHRAGRARLATGKGALE